MSNTSGFERMALLLFSEEHSRLVVLMHHNYELGVIWWEM